MAQVCVEMLDPVVRRVLRKGQKDDAYGLGKPQSDYPTRRFALSRRRTPELHTTELNLEDLGQLCRPPPPVSNITNGMRQDLQAVCHTRAPVDSSGRLPQAWSSQVTSGNEPCFQPPHGTVPGIHLSCPALPQQSPARGHHRRVVLTRECRRREIAGENRSSVQQERLSAKEMVTLVCIVTSTYLSRGLV